MNNQDISKKNNRMLLVLGMMAFLANGDNYAAATLLSNISKDLNLDISTAAFSVTAYMLSFGIFTIIFGPLSDRFGKANVINVAAVGTAIFSILGGFAFDLPSLIFFRSMNGMFGAGIFPVTMALVGETFDDNNRQAALGKVMGIAFLGAASSTVLGGAIAYFGSWRYVYIVYGVGELILAIIMFKILERDKPNKTSLNIFESYKEPLTDFRFMRLVAVLFFVGFTVFGSFTYAGIFIMGKTGYSILTVGLILSLYGVGTVVGGRMAQKIRIRLKNSFLVIAGLIGFVSLEIIAISDNVALIGIGLFGFGVSFIFLQSTLIATVQQKLPKSKGTAMSMASFFLFFGAALGTSVNGQLMKICSTQSVFMLASFIILVVGIIAAIFVSRFEMRQRKLAID